MGLPDTQGVMDTAETLRNRLIRFLDNQQDPCVASLRDQPVPQETP
jgi:hypothetical protein